MGEQVLNCWTYAVALICGIALGCVTAGALSRRFKSTSIARDSRNALKRVFDGLDVPVFVYDLLNCRIRYINPAMKKRFGLSDDAVGRCGHEVIGHCYDSPSGFCPRERILNSPDTAVGNVIRREIDGRSYRQDSFAIDWNGGKDAQLIYFADMTDAVDAQAQITAAKDAAEAANHAKSEFLARMSHEIRTPMNAVIGMTSVAIATEDSDKRDECLTKIDSASRHLLNVINEILDISKIEANKVEITDEMFDMGATLKKILNMLDWRLSNKRRDFIVNIDDIPSLVTGDDVRLSQIIVNLLSNADKFTPEGGKIVLNIKNQEETDSDCVLRVEVADNGIGIPVDQQPRLFKSFEQADKNTSKHFGGTGLGLAISKKLVEMMGGNIWVESELGKGATFIFTLKLKKYRSSTRRVDVGAVMNSAREVGKLIGGESDTEKATDWNSLPDDIKSGARRALLAEDVEINRELVSMYFEDSGITLDFAENGKEALDMFEKDPEKYCLILMDIQMPVMDGYEAARAIRAVGAEWAKNVPIIAMTANVFKEDIDNCFAAGMNDHIGKPIDMEVLHDKVFKILSRSP